MPRRGTGGCTQERLDESGKLARAATQHGAPVRQGTGGPSGAHETAASRAGTSPAGVPWWGTTPIEREKPRRWRLGPLSLWVERLSHEWRVAYAYGPDPYATTFEVAAPSGPPPDDATVERFGSSSPGHSVALRPALADRPIVTRPAEPFALLPGESVEVFVSSPVWVVVTLGARSVPALEVPSQRPTDTWFGPSTREGELCYATRTTCRLERDELPVRPHRATTPVTLRNRAATVLRVDRISMPVEHLSLHADAGARLFTEPITLERREDGVGLAELEVGTFARDGAEAPVRVAPPREPRPQGRLVRVFSHLF